MGNDSPSSRNAHFPDIQDGIHSEINELRKYYVKDASTNSSEFTDDGLELLQKIRLSIDIIEKHYCCRILAEANLNRFINKIIDGSKDEAHDIINYFCGIKCSSSQLNSDDIENKPMLLAKMLSYIQACEGIKNRDTIDMASYLSNIDNRRTQAMNSMTGINTQDTVIKNLKDSGKLDEYLSLYQLYFDKSKGLAVEAAKPLENNINKLLSHAVSKTQISLEEVNTLYDSVISCIDIFDETHRPNEVKDILKEITKLKVRAGNRNIEEVIENMGKNTNSNLFGICKLVDR